MLAFTHIAAGCASSLLVSGALNAPSSQMILMLGGGILGSMMLDIDHSQSAFGKRVPPLLIPIATVFGHRGISHSLLAVAGMSWLIWWSLHHLHWHQGYAVPVVAGVATGYLSHLAGGWLTNSGVPLL